MHELSKLDAFLAVPEGTSYEALIRHGEHALLNERLETHGIRLDADGMVPRDQRDRWRNLMVLAGVSKRYWKDPDLLTDDVTIEDMGGVFN